MIVLDFETRSRCDLRKTGSSVYAKHPSTEILCLAWCAATTDVQLWAPGDPTPSFLLNRIVGGELISAHNVGFERQMWSAICVARYGWPEVPADQWRCTLAECSRLTLPRSLQDAGSALGLKIQKDDAGHRLMLKMCKPRKTTKTNKAEWHETQSDLKRLYEYCKTDVAAQRQLANAVVPLTPSELRVWQLDQTINLRGIPIDREGIEQAIRVVDQVMKSNTERLQYVTAGRVQTPKQVLALRDWLQAEHGVDLPDLAAATVAKALDGDLPDDAREVLEIRQATAKASTAKLQAFLSRCDDDGRVRNNLLYHGAATGRWSGAGVQIQNFPRGILKPAEIEIAHQVLNRGPQALDLLLAGPMDVLSSCLRSFVKAEEGKRFLIGDFASIEARVLAWIAGQADLLDVFKAGGDVYVAMASKIYSVDVADVTKTQRHIGKMAILGLGYGMGFRNFKEACRTMAGVDIDRKFAKTVVSKYRKSNDRIVAFWRDLNTACVRAIQTGYPHQVGRLTITADANWLKIKLPSGRELHYCKPDLVEVVAPWSEGYVGDITASLDDKDAIEDLDVELGPWIKGTFHECDVPKSSLKALKDFLNPERAAARKAAAADEKIRRGAYDRLNPEDKDAVDAAALAYEIDPVLVYRVAEQEWLVSLQEHKTWEAVLTAARKGCGLDKSKARDVEEAGRDHSTVPGFDQVVDELQNNHPELNWGHDPADTLWDKIREGFTPRPKITDEDILNRSAAYAWKLEDADDPYLQDDIEDVDPRLDLTPKEPQHIWQIEYSSVNGTSRKWQRTRTYGGKLTENVVQAIARDFLVEAMLRLERDGYPIIGTVHDEVIAERIKGSGSLEEFERIMSQVPAWGAGCPIAVEGVETERYQK